MFLIQQKEVEIALTTIFSRSKQINQLSLISPYYSLTVITSYPHKRYVEQNYVRSEKIDNPMSKLVKTVKGSHTTILTWTLENTCEDSDDKNEDDDFSSNHFNLFV